MVDHYALDTTWHDKVGRRSIKILAIDDLADRKLSCNLLVNQNLGFNKKSYAGLVTPCTQYLLGPEYAILRPEFGILRNSAKIHRGKNLIKKVLVSMGGADANDYTFKTLLQLSDSNIAASCEFIVVTGPAYKNLSRLIKLSQTSKLTITIEHNIENMAELMLEADLCIGASGSTNWERCCLGLPTIIITIAQNQVQIAKALEDFGAVIYSSLINLRKDFELFLMDVNKSRYLDISKKATALCDGLGATKVIKMMEDFNEN